MDPKRVCFFTYADNDWRYMAQTMVNSMRVHGVTSDIICFGDTPILGATKTYYRKLTTEQKHLYFFKLDLLTTFAYATQYDYLVWLDADILFVRPPPADFLAPMEHSPLHIHLGWDFGLMPGEFWWGILHSEIIATYRKYGVITDTIHVANGGFWIVERKFITTMYDMVQQFRTAKPSNAKYVDELVIGWVLHLVTRNLNIHIGSNLRSDYVIYEPDVYRLPLDETLYIRNNIYPYCNQYVKVDPAIVHLVHGKTALLEAGRAILE